MQVCNCPSVSASQRETCAPCCSQHRIHFNPTVSQGWVYFLSVDNVNSSRVRVCVCPCVSVCTLLIMESPIMHERQTVVDNLSSGRPSAWFSFSFQRGKKYVNKSLKIPSVLSVNELKICQKHCIHVIKMAFKQKKTRPFFFLFFTFIARKTTSLPQMYNFVSPVSKTP